MFHCSFKCYSLLRASSSSHLTSRARSASSRKVPRVLSCRSRTAIACSFSRKSSNRKKKMSAVATSSSSEVTTSDSNADSGINEEDDDDEDDDDSSDEYASEDLPDTESNKGSEDSNDDSVSATTSSSVDIVPSTDVVRRIVPSLRPSYFPNVPPYMNFCLHDEKTEPLPAEIQKHLKWRLSPITPVVVKKTLTNSGMYKVQFLKARL
jgi:recombination DNA repair RAD52 pathway protein